MSSTQPSIWYQSYSEGSDRSCFLTSEYGARQCLRAQLLRCLCCLRPWICQIVAKPQIRCGPTWPTAFLTFTFTEHTLCVNSTQICFVQHFSEESSTLPSLTPCSRPINLSLISCLLSLEVSPSPGTPKLWNFPEPRHYHLPREGCQLVPPPSPQTTLTRSHPLNTAHRFRSE